MGRPSISKACFLFSAITESRKRSSSSSINVAAFFFAFLRYFFFFWCNSAALASDLTSDSPLNTSYTFQSNASFGKFWECYLSALPWENKARCIAYIVTYSYLIFTLLRSSCSRKFSFSCISSMLVSFRSLFSYYNSSKARDTWPLLSSYPSSRSSTS